MYLSKLILNPRNAAARRDVAAPYELHRTLLRGLGPAAESNRVLFRLEPEAHPDGPAVLVQTDRTPPDWSALLDNRYLVCAGGPKPFEPELASGERLRFRLAANPVKKRNGRRIPLVFGAHEDEAITTYMQWLDRQAGRWGFRVVRVKDTPFRLASNRTQRSEYAKHEIPHFGVRFDGVLEVDDPDPVAAAMRAGIGPAKAFGFGLLSLGRLA